MEYIELIVKTDPVASETNEIIFAKLSELGFDSMMETESGLKAYIPVKEFNEKDLDFSFLPPKIKLDYSVNKLKEQNWNAEWEKNFKPVIIEPGCRIRATFHPAEPPVKYDIIIEPQMSFGTGHHETTSLMIQYLLKTDFRKKKVLDMGCGTGVLSILAAKRGAIEIDAIDIDEWAFKNSLQNTSLNQCENINVLMGNYEVIPEKNYDFIFANINRNILLEEMEFYCKHLKENGHLLLSGFYMGDMSSILAKAMDNNLVFGSFKEKNQWVSVLFKKR